MAYVRDNLGKAIGVLIALLVLACNDGPLSLENKIFCSNTLGCFADSTTLGPVGGSVSLRDGAVAIMVPEGALTEYLEFGAEPATTWTADDLVNTGTPLEFRPHGVTFAQPVSVTVQYDPGELAANVLEDELRLYRFGDGIWTEIDGSAVDTSSNQVTATVNSFSTLHPRGVDVASVVVSPADTTVPEGQEVHLTAVALGITNDTLPNRVVEWSSSNVSIAAVDSDGSVFAYRPGTATITASSEAASGASEVVVTRTDVDRVSVEPSSLTLTLGQSRQLRAIAEDADENELVRVFEWTVADTSVARITHGGVLYAVGDGTTVVWASVEGEIGAAVLTVTTPQVHYVNVSPASATTYEGGTVQLTATPLSASFQPVPGRVVSWESDNESVATVTGSGLVTGVSLGTATMTATETVDGVDTTAIITVGVETQAPSVPTNLTAIAVSSSQINLNWTASTDNFGVVGYEITRNGSVVDSSVTTSYSDAGLTPATLFVYTVSAFDAAGNESASSASAGATTPGLPDTEAPTIPTNLTAVAVSSSRINLSWTASTDNVGVEGYEVSRDGVAIDSTSSTSYADVGLSPSTEYTYRVSAYDLAGHGSGPSASASATTNAVVSGSALLETTFDCGVQTQYNAPGGTDFDCDGLRRHTASTATDASGSHYDSITTAANYSGGLGGGGFRHKVGDGSNNQGGGVAVFFDTPQTELWIRAYFRYEAGFQWGGTHGPQPGYDKWYYIRNEGGVAAVAGFQSGVRGRLGIYRQSGLDRYPYVASEGWAEMFPGNVSDGSWYCVEYHIEMDTYTNGVSNGDGTTRIWLDGELVGSNEAYKWSDDVAAAASGWTWFGIFTNQSHPENGRVMYVDFDDLVIYNTTPPNVDAYGNPMIGPVGWP